MRCSSVELRACIQLKNGNNLGLFVTEIECLNLGESDEDNMWQLKLELVSWGVVRVVMGWFLNCCVVE